LDEASKEIQVVSCANVIPLKRIDKIIDGLALLTNFQVKWTHFGDGHLMDDIKAKASALPNNIQVDFRGNIPNKEILALYKSQSVNLFVHTSETEGLGMAIIEAQSFGIPAVVIGVGGVLDIVSEKTGVVLSPESEGLEIAAAKRLVLEGQKNTQNYRDYIQKYCLNIFNAKRNYKAQYAELIGVANQSDKN
jgi:glycosyltransferase involved in cell wall biosynthesis